MELSESLFVYLEDKIKDFVKTKKSSQFLFTCPNQDKHFMKSNDPTATIINGSDKITCLICGFKGTIYDVVRLVEGNPLTDDEAISLLTKKHGVNPYSEFDKYVEYGWTLLEVATNGKNPLEKGWTEKTHYDKSEWIKWRSSGKNVGCQTGKVSKITVVDVDLKIAPTPQLEELYNVLNSSKTLMQSTPHGKHFIFKYDESLKTGTKLNGMEVDIRNDGAQIIVAPSNINNNAYSWVNLGAEIKEITEEIKSKLLSPKSEDLGRSPQPEPEKRPDNVSTLDLKNNNLQGCRNDTFVRLGGILLKELPPEKVEFALSVINQQLLESPLPSSEIRAMIGSLTGYKTTEETSQERAIMECCKLLQSDIHAKDIMDHTGLKRAVIDKFLCKFTQIGMLVRIGRGRYNFRTKIEWVDSEQEKGEALKYEVPYFDTVANFKQGDIVLIGAPSGKGKTHVAINMVKQFVKQEIKPYYISLESGSRYGEITEKMGIKISDFYVSKEPIISPMSIEIEPNAVSIIDWLFFGEDFAMTQNVFKHLSDEMRLKKGILIVFTQLKENYEYFAVNLIKSFPAFAARFIWDDVNGLNAHFQVDKIREPRGHYQEYRINTLFNFDTKEITKIN